MASSMVVHLAGLAGLAPSQPPSSQNRYRLLLTRRRHGFYYRYYSPGKCARPLVIEPPAASGQDQHGYIKEFSPLHHALPICSNLGVYGQKIAAADQVPCGMAGPNYSADSLLQAR